MLHRLFTFCLLGLFLSGCGSKDEIAVYDVPKSQESAPTSAPFANPSGLPGSAQKAAAPGAMRVLPGMAESSSEFPLPIWSVPEGWMEVPAQPPRRGSFLAEGAEIAVTVFPGDVGGVEANAARWARQVNAPAGADSLQPDAEIELADGTTALVFQFDGTSPDGPTSLRGAILSRPDHTWFVKLSGPTDVVRRLGPSFDAFAGSFEF